MKFVHPKHPEMLWIPHWVQGMATSARQVGDGDSWLCLHTCFLSFEFFPTFFHIFPKCFPRLCHFSSFPHHFPRVIPHFPKFSPSFHQVFPRFSHVFHIFPGFPCGFRPGWRLAHHLLRCVTGDATVASNAAAANAPWPRALQLWCTARRRRGCTKRMADFHSIWRFPEIGRPPNHPLWQGFPLQTICKIVVPAIYEYSINRTLGRATKVYTLSVAIPTYVGL